MKKHLLSTSLAIVAIASLGFGFTQYQRAEDLRRLNDIMQVMSGQLRWQAEQARVEADAQRVLAQKAREEAERQAMSAEEHLKLAEQSAAVAQENRKRAEVYKSIAERGK